MENLIYDRTQADVDAGLDKARASVDFLNRIESWCAYLAERLREYGYAIVTNTRKKTWMMSDFPYRSEIDRIRHNVDNLQQGFYSLPDWREIVYNNTIDFNQANALEWDLQTIDIWLQRMMAAFFYCGELYSGDV